MRESDDHQRGQLQTLLSQPENKDSEMLMNAWTQTPSAWNIPVKSSEHEELEITVERLKAM